MAQSYDLVLVGGGLAASTLAKSMAERGARVLVLEREQQFRDRVRGELMTPWGVAEAQKLGIYNLLRDTVAHEVPFVDFFSGTMLMTHRDVTKTTPQQLPCLAFHHPAMQEALLDAAARAGACVRRGVTVTQVRTGTSPTVVVGQDGRTEEINARTIVGADGRSSRVRVSAGFEVLRDPEDLLVAGVLMDGISGPEDAGKIVINSTLGQIATIFPQGKGRARAYLAIRNRTK